MVLLGIVDDAQPGFIIYSGSQWTHLNRPSNYNGTLTECQLGTQVANPSPSFSFSFYGTAVNLYGGPITSNTAFDYSVDGAALKSAVVNLNAVGRISGSIWSLAGLSSANEHTLKVVPVAGLFSLNYITFTPTTLTTQLTNNLNVALDDRDSTLQYTGNWTNSFAAIPNGVSYAETRTGSSTEGNTMELQFEGSSITVNGLLNQVPGKLSASFSVDGGNAAMFSPFNGSQQANASSWAFSQQFYHKDLSPGKHSLLVKVQQATESQVLWIDSVVYGATTATSIDGTLPNTGNSGSSSTLKWKILGIVVGVVVFSFIAKLLQIQNQRRKKTAFSRTVVQQQQQPPLIQETRIPIPQPQPYYPPPLPPPQNFGYDNGPDLPLREIYPANYAQTLVYNRPGDNQAPPVRNEVPSPRTTYTPRQDEDGLDFSPSAAASRNAQRAIPSSPVQHQDRNPTVPSSTATASNSAVRRLRPPSPPQQDGSDGVQQQQWDSAPVGTTTQHNQLDGSESLTQLDPHTTVLTYHNHTVPQTNYNPGHPDGLVSRGGAETDPTSKVTGTVTARVENEENDDPPPYNPYE